MVAGALQSARAYARLAGFAGATAAAWARLRAQSLGAEPSLEACEAGSRRLGAALVALCGLRVECDGDVPPPGVVLVANHRSYADVAVLASLVRCTFVAKHELAGWPVVGPWLRACRTIFVRRGDFWTGSLALREIRARVRAGRSVAAFPEGTTASGAVLPFRAGAFRLAALDGLAVVPAAIEYERDSDAWTDPGDASFVPHFVECFGRREVRVRVRFGPAMRGRDGEALRQRARDWIAANVRRPGESRAAPRVEQGAGARDAG